MELESALPLSAASTIVDAALETARASGMAPLTVAVLDAGGHLVALKREDGSGILRVEIAIGKAWGALGMGQSSRAIRDRLHDSPAFLNALAAASGGRFVAVPGGVLITNVAGAVVGAVGISGDRSEKDEYCAIIGVRAAGYASDPAEPDPSWDGGAREDRPQASGARNASREVARSRFFCTLPMLLRGRSSTNTTRFGVLKAASWARVAATIASASGAALPGRRLTTAKTPSPKSGWGTPITADSATPSCASITASISLG